MDDADAWKGEPEARGGDVGYGLVWRFVDQSRAFVLGVEAGIIYERMQRREETITATVHAENDEELRNLANACDYQATFDDCDEAGAWLTAVFTRMA